MKHAVIPTPYLRLFKSDPHISPGALRVRSDGNPSRDPLFRNFAPNGSSWSRCKIDLPIKGTSKVEKRTSSKTRWKDILQHLPICVTFSSFRPRSTKVGGACSGVQRPRDIKGKTFFSTLGTLQPLETSARLSQETRTESWDAEKLRFWDAEMPRCWVAEFWERPEL